MSDQQRSGCQEDLCLTCGDVAVPARVTRLLADGLALVDAGAGEEEVSVALVTAQHDRVVASYQVWPPSAVCRRRSSALRPRFMIRAFTTIRSATAGPACARLTDAKVHSHPVGLANSRGRLVLCLQSSKSLT